MKTAISIPDPLFDAAEGLAERLGISRSELYQRAVRAYLHAHRASVVTENLDAVYGADESRVDALLDEMQWASTAGDDEWR